MELKRDLILNKLKKNNNTVPLSYYNRLIA